MRIATGIAVCWLAALTGLLLSAALARADGPPPWAYADTATPEANALPPDDGKIRTVPGSAVQYSISQIRNFYDPPDWYPGEHATPPPLAAHGVNPGIFACGYCHLPNGNGRPENANIAGLPASYIVQQVKDMASGARTSSLPNHFPQKLMLALAKAAASDPGLALAAEYFAAMTPKAVTKIVETETIPKVEVYRWVYKKSASPGREPLGQRLIELPDNIEGFENRDGHMTYTAFVRPGSLAKGEELVKTGAGKTTACAICHGAGLKGLGPVPPIAGRSPGYLARQLFDFQSGARNGAWSALMKPVVAGLSNEDLVAITAYLASQEP